MYKVVVDDERRLMQKVSSTVLEIDYSSHDRKTHRESDEIERESVQVRRMVAAIALKKMKFCDSSVHIVSMCAYNN